MIEFKHACPLTGNTEYEAQLTCQEGTKGSFCKNVTNVKQYLHENNKIEVVGLDGGHFYDVAIAAKVKNCWDGNGSKCVTTSKPKIVFLGKLYEIDAILCILIGLRC